MDIQSANRTERSMRVVLFLALLLGVCWAMLADGGRAEPAAAIAGVLGGQSAAR